MARRVNLSLPRQNYLETIFALCEEHGHAHGKAIAGLLGVSMPSVSEALRGLAAEGVIHYRQRQAVTLTPKGTAIARELALRHAVLATFYERILGCTHKRADEIACRVEHVVDADLINRMHRVSVLLTDAMARAGVDSILALPYVGDPDGACNKDGSRT
jgi:DtxR family Mn-dependent transcriptional regulator